MKIQLETIPHQDQRYDTVGDWQVIDGSLLLIKVSRLPNPLYEQLIAVHELLEALICRKWGITSETVDDWDMKFSGEGEPGDAPGCPYGDAHRFATRVETMLAHKLGVDWPDYEEAIEALPAHPASTKCNWRLAGNTWFTSCNREIRGELQVLSGPQPLRYCPGCAKETTYR